MKCQKIFIIFLKKNRDVSSQNEAYSGHITGKLKKEGGAFYPIAPLGPCVVAGLMPSGVEIRFQDLNLGPLLSDNLAWADAVFISYHQFSAHSFDETTKLVKEYQIPVVCGGIGISDHYMRLNIENVDHFIFGEAEPIFDKFWQDFQNNSAKRVYAEVFSENFYKELCDYFGKDQRIILNPIPYKFEKSIIPRYDILDLPKYQLLCLEWSRGCEGVCDFCSECVRLGHLMRYKKPQDVLKEFQTILDMGFRGPFFVVDIDLTGNIEELKKILKEVILWQEEHKFPFAFACQCTIAVADDEELLDLLAEANFLQCFLGLETVDDEKALEAMNKTKNLEKRNIRHNIASIEKRGINVASGIVFGFDGEAPLMWKKIAEFLASLNICTVGFGIPALFERTPLLEKMRKNGRLKEDEWEIVPYRSVFEYRYLPLYKMERPDAEYLKDQQKIIRFFYDEKLALNGEKIKNKCLNNEYSTMRVKQLFASNKIKKNIFLCRLTIQLLGQKCRWSFLKLLINIIFRKPSALPFAIGLFHRSFRSSYTNKLIYKKMQEEIEKREKGDN